jgi:hypothetical protein
LKQQQQQQQQVAARICNLPTLSSPPAADGFQTLQPNTQAWHQGLQADLTVQCMATKRVLHFSH